MDILVTTYPARGSRNVGDSLITQSTINLIREHHPRYNPKIVFREESLDQYDYSQVNSLIVPGFSINNNSYPDLFNLFSEKNNLDKIYPIGCSFQSNNVGDEVYQKHFYSPTYLNFLNKIVERVGPILCRDMKIVEMLRDWQIKSEYIGDLALYSQYYKGKMILPIKNPRSIVFTIQHKPVFAQQSFTIIDMIARRYKNQKKYVSFHSLPNKNSILIAQYAKKKGFKVLEVFGDSDNLNVYENIDLHIGYRLHGHIYFLRSRKASVLIIEDSRSYGISRTAGLSLGAFMGFETFPDYVDLSISKKIDWFLEKSASIGFVQYNQIFKKIDDDYDFLITKHFSNISQKIKSSKL